MNALFTEPRSTQTSCPTQKTPYRQRRYPVSQSQIPTTRPLLSPPTHQQKHVFQPPPQIPTSFHQPSSPQTSRASPGKATSLAHKTTKPSAAITTPILHNISGSGCSSQHQTKPSTRTPSQSTTSNPSGYSTGPATYSPSNTWAQPNGEPAEQNHTAPTAPQTAQISSGNEIYQRSEAPPKPPFTCGDLLKSKGQTAKKQSHHGT